MPSFPIRDRFDKVVGEISLTDEMVEKFEHGHSIEFSPDFRKTGNRQPILTSFITLIKFKIRYA